MERLLKRILVVLTLVVLTGAAVIAWHLWPRRQHFYTDADTIKTPQDVAVIREILWEPPALLPDGLNTNVDDYEPELSADGQTMFFVRGRAGHNADIAFCERTPDGWSEPKLLTTVNTEYDELGPELSSDGNSLYFYSDRLGSLGGYDLWVSHRGVNGWRPATNLGPAANSPFNDYGPALSPDAAVLYFSSNRPRPEDTDQPRPDAWPATLREERHIRDYDIYVCALTDSGVGRAVALDAVNTEFNDGAPTVSPFGDFMYFSSDRPGGFGGYDVYRSRRLRGRHEPATNLGPIVNTAANELDPDMSLGGYGLHFSSDRGAVIDKPPGDAADRPPDYDLYYTTSREVFREIETVRASIDWGALWREIGPNLLWGLLALTLLLLFLALLRDFQQRKMSLLARCLLASLMLHLLLLLLLNVVEVTTSLANVIRGRGKIQVALLSNAAADEIAGQIRGDLTQVDAPEPEQVATEPPEFLEAVEPTDVMATLTVERASVSLNELPTVPPAPPDSPQPVDDFDVPLEVDAEAQSAETLPAMDIAMPTEAAPVEAAETTAPVLPAAAAGSMDRAAALAIVTTQPALPSSDYAFEPTRIETANLDDVVDLAVAEQALRDAEPAPSSRVLPSPSTPHAEALAAVLPDLSIPTDEARPSAEISEAPPAVEVAATESIRPPADSVVSRLAQPQPSAPIAEILPKSASHGWRETSVLSDPEIAPSEAMPLAASLPASIEHAEAIFADLPELSIPADQARPPNDTRETAPAVAVAAAESIRSPADAIVSRLAQPQPSSPIAEILPKSASHGWRETSALSGPDIAPNEAMPRPASPPTSVERATDAALSSLSEIDLPRPAEVAARAETAESGSPPVATAAPAHLRAASVLAATRDPGGFAGESVALPPAAGGAAREEPVSLADVEIFPEDAATDDLAIRGGDPQTLAAAVSDALPLELALPSETEPPGKHEVPGSAIGTIHGHVIDADTREPLPGATVRLALPDDESVVVTGDESGFYELAVPPVPEFFALSASVEGYVPGTANIPAAMLSDRPLTVHFELPRQTEHVITLEEDPDVHHLGNDRFAGRINSRFQKSSEGKTYTGTFEVTAEQAKTDYDRAEVWLMAKGVQCPHQIRINGRLLQERLDESPRDGSFGWFALAFDPDLLRPGTNKFKITAVSCRGDLDDFEFVNVQIRLWP